MSITDELRGFMDGADGYELWCPRHKKELVDIADRIDAEHEKATSEFWQKTNAVPATDENMAEHGWLRLPVDDDGEVVRVGSLCKVYPFDEPAKKVRALQVSGFGWRVIFEDGTEEHLYRVRVYDPPTTEDVLCELLNEYRESECTLSEDRLAEYAKRLQLKEVDE